MDLVEPVLTRQADGTVTVEYPEGSIPGAMIRMSRELFGQFVSDHNHVVRCADVR